MSFAEHPSSIHTTSILLLAMKFGPVAGLAHSGATLLQEKRWTTNTFNAIK